MYALMTFVTHLCISDCGLCFIKDNFVAACHSNPVSCIGMRRRSRSREPGNGGSPANYLVTLVYKDTLSFSAIRNSAAFTIEGDIFNPLTSIACMWGC